jgi:hypothetical protein
MRKNIKIVFVVIFSLLAIDVYSQGCSDAGICSLGSLSILRYKLVPLQPITNTIQPLTLVDSTSLSSNPLISKRKDTIRQVSQNNISSNSKQNQPPEPGAEYITPKYFFALMTQYGLGQNSTSIITLQLEGTVCVVKQKLFAQVKLPYTFVNGNLGNYQGMGDITLGLSYIAQHNDKSGLSFSVGMKLPSNKADAVSTNDLPLPMIYQTSLGTTDILAGVKYSFKKWDFTIGYQHPFNANNNQYLPIPLLENQDNYNNYFVANGLKRADDGIFRINRVFSYKKLSITPGLLFIYHLSEDIITDANGNRVKVDGSQGLTVNANLAGSVTVSNKMDFLYIIGAPFIDRQSHPDGLDRKLVAIIGIRYSIY